MKEAFLLSGSNLGDRQYYLEFVLQEIASLGEISNLSAIYESPAWGYNSENAFLNQCIILRTELFPDLLLRQLKKIEKKAGRARTGSLYEDRCLDIDILFYGSEIITGENLIIPHPRIHLRAFTLVPLAEIAGDFVHPVLGRTVKELLEECEDEVRPVKVGSGL